MQPALGGDAQSAVTNSEREVLKLEGLAGVTQLPLPMPWGRASYQAGTENALGPDPSVESPVGDSGEAALLD